MTMSVAARFVAFAGVLLALGSVPAPAQQRPPAGLRITRPLAAQALQTTEITPPPQVAVYARPDSVTLKAGSTDAVLRSLPVRRRLTLAQVRTRPVVALAGGSRADLSPVLTNPASTANLAARLRTQPALVQVLAEDTQVIEVEQGLIIRQFLSYKVRTGVCTDPAKRAQLLRGGGACMTRMTDGDRTAAFASPANPRYIADPAKRAQAVQRASAGAIAEQAETAQSIAQFRAMLQDPAQRAAIAAEVGAAEAVRLGALDDAALAAELANAAERQIEQVMFVPANEKHAVMTPGPLRFSPPALARPAERVEATHALPERVFLTGFTLGREYEWRHRVSVTIKWCVLGCKKTYYAEVYAGFSYGFGLRFPIRMGGLYSYQRKDGKDTASVAPVFEPIDGTAADYSQSGLPGEHVFEGKELVAQFNSWAGMAYKLPVIGSDGVRWDLGQDFTAGLPAPFTNGQFRPPAPGDANPPTAEIVFANPDLIGGLANFGLAGAKVLPAVKVALTSDRLQLKLRDHISNTDTLMTSSGQTYPLAVNPADHSSRFSIGSPEYNLAFQVTPGLAARLWVDVAVWSDHWDWPVWFPQIGVTLPPGGATFSCHAQTVCAREYVVSPDVAVDTAGETGLPADPIARQAESWRRSFVSEWKPRCSWEKLKLCETAIVAISQTTANAMEHEIRNVKSFPPLTEINRIVNQRTSEAAARAEQVIRESKVRDIETYGNSLAPVYAAIWAKGCAAQACRDRIQALTGQYVAALVKRQQNAPGLDRDQVVARENSEGKWAERARREVEGARVQPRIPPRIRLPALRPAGR